MTGKNPYAITFGRIPNQYINRGLIIDSIVETFDSDEVTEQAIKITGIRGAGKTVTLTAVERIFKEKEEWIVLGVTPRGNIVEDIVANLYSEIPYITAFVDKELNLSKFGIGLKLSEKSPVASINYALKEILKLLLKEKKRVLITIDEANRSSEMIDFIQEFQLLIREELPIFLIAAGLYEDIERLENSDGLTFFLRATKYEMTPLNFTSIRENYKKILGVSNEVAEELAAISKGYPFCYQALGKYMWDEQALEITDTVLAYVDEALSEKIYMKIWTELAPNDRWFLQFIISKDQMPVNELLEITKKKHNEWSEPRRRLSEKGIIDTKTRGMIKLKLPRFKEFVENVI